MVAGFRVFLQIRSWPKKYGRGNNKYGRGNNKYGRGNNKYGRGNNKYGRDLLKYGRGCSQGPKNLKKDFPNLLKAS